MKMLDERSEFTKKVIQLIKSIPKGRVATYGLIAKLAGKPQGSRGVGWILHSSSRGHDLPWHRVIKSGGLLSFPEMSEPYFLQKKLLEHEGVIFLKSRVDLKTYLWDKKPRLIKNRYVPKMQRSR